MNVTSAQYKLNPITNEINCIHAVIDGEDLYVPVEPENRHYQAILEWVAEGNEIQAAE